GPAPFDVNAQLRALAHNTQAGVEIALQPGQLRRRNARRGLSLGLSVAPLLQMVYPENVGAPAADAILQELHARCLGYKARHLVAVVAVQVGLYGTLYQWGDELRQTINDDGGDTLLGHGARQLVADAGDQPIGARIFKLENVAADEIHPPVKAPKP